MGSKTRLRSYCTKRANNGVNLVTSRKINTTLARPIMVVFFTQKYSLMFTIWLTSEIHLVKFLKSMFLQNPYLN